MSKHITSVTLNGIMCIHHTEHHVRNKEHPVYHREYPIVYNLLGVVHIKVCKKTEKCVKKKKLKSNLFAFFNFHFDSVCLDHSFNYTIVIIYQ